MKSHPCDNKNVLITGGTGSFGSFFARYLAQHTKAKKIIIFSRDELKQWELQKKDPILSKEHIRFFLGDVRDKDRLKLAFRSVDIVIHAAALKQVPAAEYNPSEFIKTNILGAMNVADAALETDVEKVVGLSTDKAVNPINLYGATKLCADKLLIAANAYRGADTAPCFSVVRYGNVLASRGSIIPHWQEEVRSGKKRLSITDDAMTRFWMSLHEAADLVGLALQDMQGGEVFIPKAPSVHITDLAKAFAPHYDHDICGIRKGEKIDETLISHDDARSTFENDHYYLLSQDPEKTQMRTDLKLVSKDFSLTSKNNPFLIYSIEEIQELLKKAGVQLIL